MSKQMHTSGALWALKSNAGTICVPVIDVFHPRIPSTHQGPFSQQTAQSLNMANMQNVSTCVPSRPLERNTGTRLVPVIDVLHAGVPSPHL